MEDFVSVDWLKDHLDDENVRIIDCRFQLGNPAVGKGLYENEHIPGALYFHLEDDLSGKKAAHGGRHPLPDLNDFKVLLESSGINQNTTVVAYDNGELAFASRLWLLLSYVGHQSVHILEGGFKAWKEAGLPTTNNLPTYEKSEYQLQIQERMLASYEEVKELVSSENPHAVLIDSRESKRYLGIEELIDKKAGHIPGAINKVWTEGVENGKLKSSTHQKARFKELNPAEPVIVYCGSGVTATPNFLALKSAGFKNIKLYVGSFSDWISYDENEVETDN